MTVCPHDNVSLTQTPSDGMRVHERALTMCQWLLVKCSGRLYGDTDRHHYTLSCFHSPPMKCHSVFSVLCLGCALSVLLHFSFSHFARSLSSALILPPVFVFICLSSCPSFTLTISSPCLSLSPPHIPLPLFLLYSILPQMISDANDS